MLGLCVFLAVGPLILAYQAIQWLRSGVWNPVTVAEALAGAGMGAPRTSWTVLQRMLDNFMDLEVSGVVLGVAILVSLAALYWLDRAEKRALAAWAVAREGRRH